MAAYVSRGNLIVAGCLAFSLCWVLLLASRGSTLGDVALAMTAAAAMGAGEVLLAASVPPLLNDLAPPDLIGRYNAVDALILSVGSIVGPVLTAALYFKPGASALLTVLAAGCAVAALVSRTLPTSERRSRA
jgi:MFS family permease